MKRVWIDVKSLQRFPDGHSETIELNTEGTWEEADGVQYIRYEETELTGMDGVQTEVRIYADHAEVQRTGKIRLYQEFRPNMLHEAEYETPFGKMTLHMETVELINTIADGSGDMKVGYDVSIEGMGALYNELSITVREEKN